MENEPADDTVVRRGEERGDGDVPDPDVIDAPAAALADDVEADVARAEAREARPHLGPVALPIHHVDEE
jgi:hypothetical protein